MSDDKDIEQHKLAQRCSAMAEEAKRSGLGAENVMALYWGAATFELEAFRRCPKHLRRTRSVFAVSCAALYMKAGHMRAAADFCRACLVAGRLTAWGQREIQKLLDEAVVTPDTSEATEALVKFGAARGLNGLPSIDMSAIFKE